MKKIHSLVLFVILNATRLLVVGSRDLGSKVGGWAGFHTCWARLDLLTVNQFERVIALEGWYR